MSKYAEGFDIISWCVSIGANCSICASACESLRNAETDEKVCKIRNKPTVSKRIGRNVKIEIVEVDENPKSKKKQPKVCKCTQCGGEFTRKPKSRVTKCPECVKLSRIEQCLINRRNRQYKAIHEAKIS